MDIRPAFAERNIPVAISTDENFLPYVKVLVNSIVACTQRENLDVFVLHDGIPDAMVNEFLSSFDIGARLSIRFIDPRERLKGTKLERFGQGEATSHYPIVTYFRLFLPGLLSRYDKILYLDVDTIVCSDMSALYDIDLGDCLFGAARDIFSSTVSREYFHWAERHGLTEFDDYVNAGVLLMNLDGIRKADVFDSLMDVSIDSTRWFVDQDAINIVCKGRIGHIDPLWDWMVGTECIRRHVLLMPGKPRIYHYTGGDKPWKKPQHLFAHLWWRHAGRDGAALWRRAFGSPGPTRIGEGVCASVVLVLNDSEDYLHETLYSLEAQTLENAEFICVANGVSAETRRICETFAARDRRFGIVDLPGQGVPAAMNAGIDMAKGRWLFFAEADDFAHPEMLAEMCAAGDREGADVLSAGMYVMDKRMASDVRVYIPRTRFDGEGIEPWNRAFSRKLVTEGGIRFLGEVDDLGIRFSVEALLRASSPGFLGRAYYYRRKNAHVGRPGRAPCGVEGVAAAYVEAKKLVDGADRWAKYDFFKVAVSHCLAAVLDLRTHEDRERAVSHLHAAGIPALRFRDIDDSNIYQEDFGEAFSLVEKGVSVEDFLVAMLSARESHNARGMRSLRRKARLRQRAVPNDEEAMRLKRSEAYRVGMLITWPLRMAKQLVCAALRTGKEQVRK